MRRLIIILIAALLALPSQGSSAGRRSFGKVLFLGDSFSIGAFGRTLDTRMRENGLEVFTVVAGGASPYYWLDAYQSLPCTIGYWEKSPKDERRLGYIKAVPKIEDLLAEIHPNIVVVQTGVNLYATLRSKRRPKEDNVREVRKLIDQMCFAIAKRGAKGYWILPPHSHEARYPKSLQDELAGLMKEIVKEYNGAVFESQKYTEFTDPYPSTDGIHYGPQEASLWAERVASDFRVYLQINGSYASRIPEREEEEKSKFQLIASTTPQSAVAAVTGRAPASTSISPEDLVKQAPEVDLTLRLLEKSTLQNLTDVPYNNALGVYEYEVLSDGIGNYPLKRIRVAHGIVFNRKFTSIAKTDLGHEITLRLVPLSKYRSLQTWQTVDDLRPNFELPLYTPKLD